MLWEITFGVIYLNHSASLGIFLKLYEKKSFLIVAINIVIFGSKSLCLQSEAWWLGGCVCRRGSGCSSPGHEGLNVIASFINPLGQEGLNLDVALLR